MSIPSSWVTRWGHVEGVGVTHRDDLINEARVVVRRPEVLTHAFGQIRPALATEIDRTFGSAATILIAGVLSLRISHATIVRRFGARDEVRHRAVGVRANLRSRVV